MLQRASSTFVLVLLAACQSAPSGHESEDEWRARIERSQTELVREVQSVRSLLADRVLGPAAVAAGGLGSTMESASSIELNARIAALSDSLERLNATMSTAAAERPTRSAQAGGASAAAGAASVTAAAASAAALWPLEEALLVLEQQHALHCENLANVGVPGYKRRTLLLTTVPHDPSGLRLPRAIGAAIDTAAGALELTGNQLDFGVEGAGFFEVRLPDGDLRYTRNGTFRQDVKGRLVTAEGHLLTDQVSIPPDTHGISISKDGQVFALGDLNVLEQIGTIRLHVFSNATALEAVEGNRYAPTVSSGPAQARQPGAQGAGVLAQGYIERSNVEITGELIDLQLVERQANAVRRVLASRGIYTR